MVYMGNHISKAWLDGEYVTRGKNGYWLENLKEID